MTSILIVDDHQMFCESLSLALSDRVPDVEVHTSYSGFSAIQKFEEKNRYDIVMLDMNLPGLGGKEIFKRLRMLEPEQSIAFVSASDDPADLEWAIDNGASSFIPKTFRLDVLCTIIEIVRDNGSYFPMPRDLAATRPTGFMPPAVEYPVETDDNEPALDLTRRQLEVAELVSKGHSNKAIAHSLGISEVTVKMHLRKTMQKMNLTNRTQLAGIIWKYNGNRIAG